MVHDADKLILDSGTGPRQEFTLSKGSVTIGRAMTNDVQLRDPLASRCHARIDRIPAGCEIIDLGSANGVLVNGVPATRALLKAGDVVTIGATELQFRTGE